MVFLAVRIARCAALERRFQHGLLELHHIGSVDEGDELRVLVIFAGHDEALRVVRVLIRDGLRAEGLLPLGGALVHFLDLLVDHAEDGVGLQLHRPATLHLLCLVVLARLNG